MVAAVAEGIVAWVKNVVTLGERIEMNAGSCSFVGEDEVDKSDSDVFTRKNRRYRGSNTGRWVYENGRCERGRVGGSYMNKNRGRWCWSI